MIIELTMGVPLWNVVRFITLSVIMTTVLSRVWSSGVALRAGARVSTGHSVRLKPRPYTRGSLVTEEDDKDWKLKILLLSVTVALFTADLLIEFGSGTAARVSHKLIDVGYNNLEFEVPMEVRDLGKRRWAPARRVYRDFNASYRVWGGANYQEGGYTLTESDLEIIRNPTDIPRSDRQVLPGDTDIFDEWVVIGSGEDLWFSGGACMALLRDKYVILFSGDQFYVLEEISNRGDPSIAVVEMVINKLLWSNLPVHSRFGNTLVVEMYRPPSLSIDCGRAPEYPSSWDVRCIDPSTQLGAVHRHDRDAPEVDQLVLAEYGLNVNYGKRTRPDINWDVLLESRSVSASQDTGRVASEVLYSVNVTMVTTRTIGAILVRDGVKASICLVPMTHFNDTSDLICRGRAWDDEKEMLSAFQAIQLTAANYNNLWQISTHWADPDNELAHTRVSWISPQLKERRGRVLSDVRTVATVNVFFLVGVTIVVAVLLMGCCLSAVTWWSNSGAPESCKFVTLDGSRRVLAMSLVSKYNCSQVPSGIPTTALIRKGEFTCHLSTYYSTATEVLSLKDAHSSGLLVMGGRKPRPERD